MLEVLFCANAEGNPPRVGNPLMFLCKTLVQECVTNRSRERNIDNAAHVHMANFGFTESEFPGCKAMRMNRDIPPSRNLLFHSFQLSVHWVVLPDSSFDARQPRLGICAVALIALRAFFFGVMQRKYPFPLLFRTRRRSKPRNPNASP